MSSRLQQMLSRFGSYNQKLWEFRELMRTLRAAQKPDRSTTYKPAFSCGFRGAPRTMNKPGSIPAPTIDQVRRIERAYMCKLDVRQGLMYFRGTKTAFTHERGRKHRQLRMLKMAKDTGANVPLAGHLNPES